MAPYLPCHETKHTSATYISLAKKSMAVLTAEEAGKCNLLVKRGREGPGSLCCPLFLHQNTANAPLSLLLPPYRLSPLSSQRGLLKV